MRYRLRTLLILLAVGPLFLAIGWFAYPVWLPFAWWILGVAIAAQALVWVAKRCSYFV